MAGGFLSKPDATSPPSAKKELSYEFFKDALSRDPVAQLGFDVDAAAMMPLSVTEKYHLPAGLMGKPTKDSDYRTLKAIVKARPNLEGKETLMYHPSTTSYDPAFQAVVLHEARHRTDKKYPEVFEDFNESIYGQGSFRGTGEELLLRFIDNNLFPETKRLNDEFIKKTIGQHSDSKIEDQLFYPDGTKITYKKIKEDMNKLATATIDASKKLLEEQKKLLEPKEKTLIGEQPDYESFENAMPLAFYNRMKK